jgi:DNA polymerase elongation subunit (family B)
LTEGFEIIYLDTDSVFVKRQNADRDDFLALTKKIEKETGFEISLANHYRHLVLLPQEADPEIEAARRFYGKLRDGRVYYRGIELRRHDYPIFLKRFQQELLNIILEANTAQYFSKLATGNLRTTSTRSGGKEAGDVVRYSRRRRRKRRGLHKRA